MREIKTEAEEKENERERKTECDREGVLGRERWWSK